MSSKYSVNICVTAVACYIWREMTGQLSDHSNMDKITEILLSWLHPKQRLLLNTPKMIFVRHIEVNLEGSDAGA